MKRVLWILGVLLCATSHAAYLDRLVHRGEDETGDIEEVAVDPLGGAVYTNGLSIFRKKPDGQRSVLYSTSGEFIEGLNLRAWSDVHFQLGNPPSFYKVSNQSTAYQVGEVGPGEALWHKPFAVSASGSLAYSTLSVDSQGLRTRVYLDGSLFVEGNSWTSEGVQIVGSVAFLDTGALVFGAIGSVVEGGVPVEKRGIMTGPIFPQDLVISGVSVAGKLVPFGQAVYFRGQVGASYGIYRADISNQQLTLILSESSGALDVESINDFGTDLLLREVDGVTQRLVAYNLTTEQRRNLLSTGECVGGSTLTGMVVNERSFFSDGSIAFIAENEDGSLNSAVRLRPDDSPVSNPPVGIINLPNAAPVGEEFQVLGSASDDGSGGLMQYEWTVTGPPGATIDISDVNAINPYVKGSKQGTYTFRLKVKNCVGESEKTATLLLSANKPPVPTASPNPLIVASAQPVTFRVTPNDSNVLDVHSYSIVNQPPSTVGTVESLQDPDNPGDFRFIPAQGFSGSGSFRIRVEDNGFPRMSGEVTVTINSRTVHPGDDILAKIELSSYLDTIKQKKVTEKCTIWGTGKKQDNEIKASKESCGSLGLANYKTYASHACPLAAATVVLGVAGLEKLSDGSNISMGWLGGAATQLTESVDGLNGFDGDSFNFSGAAKIATREFKKKYDACYAAASKDSERAACRSSYAKKVVYKGVVTKNKDSELRSYLLAGTPVILEVKSPTDPTNSLDNKHFVVATGIRIRKDGTEEILIHEVGSEDRRSLDHKQYGGNFRNIRPLVTEQITYPSPLSSVLASLQFLGTEGVDLLVESPSGESTGFDPVTGELVNAIPGSSYSRESISSLDDPDLANRTDPVAQVGIYENVVRGSYVVSVYGRKAGCHRVQVRAGSTFDTIDVLEKPICLDVGETHSFSYEPPATDFLEKPIFEPSVERVRIGASEYLRIFGDTRTPIELGSLVTLGFSGGNILESFSAAHFVEHTDRYELFVPQGSVFSSLVLYKNGRFQATFPDQGAFTQERDIKKYLIGLLIDRNAYLGTVNPAPRPNNGLVKLSAKEGYAVGNRALITANLLVEPLDGFQFDLDLRENLSPVITSRESERLFTAWSPALPSGYSLVEGQLVRYPEKVMTSLTEAWLALTSEIQSLRHALERERRRASRNRLRAQIEALDTRISEINAKISEIRVPMGAPVTLLLEARE